MNLIVKCHHYVCLTEPSYVEPVDIKLIKANILFLSVCTQK